MKHRRRALVAIHENAVDQYVDIKRNEAIGQDSLFGGLDDDSAAGSGSRSTIPEIDEWDKMTLLGHEREMLGLYVSDHPLLGLEHVLANTSDCTIGQLMLDEDRAGRQSPITITGLVTGSSARSPSAATPGGWSPSRTSTARSTCCSSPAPGSWPAT